MHRKRKRKKLEQMKVYELAIGEYLRGEHTPKAVHKSQTLIITVSYFIYFIYLFVKRAEQTLSLNTH